MQGASRDMKDSIEATNRLGEAAVRSNVEAHRLADEAKRSADNEIETAERELRAYVGIVGDMILKCPLCDTADINKPIEITREHIADNAMMIENGGRTPAYEASIQESYWSGNFGQALPKDFNYPIIGAPPLPFPFPRSATATLNPRDPVPAESAIDRSVIPLIIKARRHMISLFYYGNVNYKDVFQKSRTTPFCYEYFPDNPIVDQLVNCPEHNSPEQNR
jgi:hypothetical protein